MLHTNKMWYPWTVEDMKTRYGPRSCLTSGSGMAAASSIQTSSAWPSFWWSDGWMYCRTQTELHTTKQTDRIIQQCGHKVSNSSMHHYECIALTQSYNYMQTHKANETAATAGMAYCCRAQRDEVSRHWWQNDIMAVSISVTDDHTATLNQWVLLPTWVSY